MVLRFSSIGMPHILKANLRRVGTVFLRMPLLELDQTEMGPLEVPALKQK